ncbi:MAG: hypothetical protein EOO43_11265 [Flavobacterium sp.]|nr:MAG: hypothetical protein EOO43_11265 [Flavobacterium sp.]
MKASASPLEILDFAIINFELNFIPPNSIEDDTRKLFDNYDLDIDFDVNVGELLRVSIKSTINEERRPGYRIFAEVVCIFKFNTNFVLSNAEKESLEGFSTIYIALNCLRGLVTQFTANAPFGRYVLPSVDLNDLIKKKASELSEGKQSMKKTSNKTKTKKVKTK